MLTFHRFLPNLSVTVTPLMFPLPVPASSRKARSARPHPHKASLIYSVRHGHEASHVGVAVQDEAKVGGHHFFPTLKPLVDPTARIGIEFIVYGVVVAKFEVQSRALRQLQRGSIRKLPIKIVAGDVQHDLFPSVGISHLILGALAANMRVGPEPHDLDILEKG